MLKFHAAFLLSASLAVLLAGCGGTHSGIVPPALTTPAASAKTKASVKFTVSVPKAAQSAARRPAYVSPATVSMSIDIMQGTTNVLTENVGLTPTSSGCSSSLASTQCVLTLALLPGSYTASISTFDAANATGNTLSTAQSVAFTVVAGTANTVPLVLSGIPLQILPAYAGSGQFYVAALDADGNYIVGVGAPSFAITQSSGSSVVTITQPTTASPDAFELTVAGGGSETLTITASYPVGETDGCAQTGAVCTTNFSVSVVKTQTLFVGNDYTDDSVVGYTVPFTSTSPAPVYTITATDPYELAVDPSGNLFIGAYSTTSPNYEFSPPSYASASAVTPTANNSSAVALDSHDNLFITSYNDCFAEYSASSHYSSAIATATAGLSDPDSEAFDANNDLFVSNYDANDVTEYASGSYSTLAATIAVGTGPEQLFFDTSGDLFVIDFTDTVEEFKPPFTSSSTPYVTISSGLSGPFRGVFDPSGDIFILNYTAGTIAEYTPPFSNGSSPSATFATGAYPYGMASDAAGNIYSVNYEGGSEGSVTEYSPPFSNSTTPSYTATTGLYYPESAAIGPASSGSLVVSL